MRDGGLRQIFQRHLPEVHWQAIESWGTGIGIPDLNGCAGGVEFWIELKRATANAVKISPGQVAWTERRLRAGGRVYVAVRKNSAASKRRAATDELHLFRGEVIRSLYTDGLQNCPALGVWPNGPASWHWADILAAMML